MQQIQTPLRLNPQVASTVNRLPRLAAPWLACWLLLWAASPAGAAPSKNVLVLTSEALETPALAIVIRDAVAALREASAGPVNVNTESLERSRFPGDDQRLLSLFRERYLAERPDLVIALCAPAVEFVLRYRDEVFRGVPVLYAFVDERMVHDLQIPASVSGVALRTDFLGLSDLAMRLHPKARRIVVAAGTSEFDRGWVASFRRISPQLEGRVAIRYLTEGTLPELLGELATLPADSLILFVSMTRDREGSVYVPRDVLDMVRRVSQAPIYGPILTYMGHGVVGGALMDVEAHGKALGTMAVRALAAGSSGQPPQVTAGRLVFDWRELNRFGIAVSALPTGAQVLYRQDEWAFRTSWVLAILFLFAAQTALIVALVAQRRKRTALQQSLDDRLCFGTLLSDVSTALNAVPLRSLDGTIRSVLERVRHYFEVDNAAILDASASPMSCRLCAGAGPNSRALAAACALAETPFGALKLASFQPLVLGSPDDLPRDPAVERALLGAGVQSLAMVAMEVGGHVLGVLCCLSHTRPTSWPAEPQQQLRTLAEVLANAVQRQQTATGILESDRLKGAILSSMSAHITVLDRHGEIIAVNDAWTAFGWANGVRDEAAISPGVNYLDVCRRAATDGAPGAQEALDGILAVCGARSQSFELEYRCDTPDIERWFDMKVVPLRRPEGGVVVTHRETTEQRRHEIALRESEERFRHLADALPVGVWVADLEARCLYVNRTWLAWTGRPLEREVGDGWAERIHANDADRAVRVFKEAVAARQPFSTEFRLQRPDGRFRWVLNHGRPRYDDGGNVLGYVGGCIDMTERFEAQTQLRELSGRLITAQEEERRRVARELHDDLQQRLALLAIELEGMALGRPLGGRAGWAAQARRLWTRTNEISTDVHRISHRLLPFKLETLGLLTTVESYCRDTAEQGLRTVFAHDNVPASVPDDVALCLFRVVQESLRNVVKHSGSAEAHVSLGGSDGSLTLVITDFGRGFDPDASTAGGGLGLLSMRERLRLLGGDLKVTSAVGAGTRIEARVPVAKERKTIDSSGAAPEDGDGPQAAHAADVAPVRDQEHTGSSVTETP
jgi:PAS domain S-box-containing protein